MNLDEGETEQRMGFERYFEKNRYFDGKLITARDMEIEQHYHAERLNIINRSVIGSGLVYGLKAEISTVNERDSELEVIVQPGLAIDNYGRPILLTEKTPVKGDIPSSENNTLYLYLGQRSQPWASTPRINDEYGSFNCEYNRAVERPYFKLTDERDSNIPTKEVSETSISANTLRSMAEFYYQQESAGGTGLVEDISDEEVTVLLGTFEKSPNEAWIEADFELGPITYTNDMLYAILANHIKNSRGRRGSYEEPTEIQNDLRNLRLYHRRIALKTLQWTFNDVCVKFGGEIAQRLHDELARSVENLRFREEFIEISNELLDMAREFEEELTEEYHISERSLDRYEESLIRLDDILDEESVSDLRIIAGLHELNEATRRLERRITEPGDMPVDVIAGINQNLIQIFRECSVRTVSDLAEFNDEGELIRLIGDDYPGLSEELASFWIKKARNLLNTGL